MLRQEWCKKIRGTCYVAGVKTVTMENKVTNLMIVMVIRTVFGVMAQRRELGKREDERQSKRNAPRPYQPAPHAAETKCACSLHWLDNWPLVRRK